MKKDLNGEQHHIEMRQLNGERSNTGAISED